MGTDVERRPGVRGYNSNKSPQSHALKKAGMSPNLSRI